MQCSDVPAVSGTVVASEDSGCVLSLSPSWIQEEDIHFARPWFQLVPKCYTRVKDKSILEDPRALPEGIPTF